MTGDGHGLRAFERPNPKGYNLYNTHMIGTRGQIMLRDDRQQMPDYWEALTVFFYNVPIAFFMKYGCFTSGALHPDDVIHESGRGDMHILI